MKKNPGILQIKLLDNGYKAIFAFCTKCVHQTVLPVFTNIGSKSDYVYYYYSGNVIKPLVAMMQWFKKHQLF